MRLLLVTNLFPSDADPVFGVFVRRQVEALRAEGIEVDLVANTDTRTGVANGLRKYAMLLARTLAASRRAKADAVVGHFLYPTAFFARIAARRAGLPYVLVAHGTDVSSVRRRGPLARVCLSAAREADLVVAVSGDLRERVRDDLGVSEDRLSEPIHMGVDTSVFSTGPADRASLGWGAEERIALFVGNLVEVKGLDVLAKAFAALNAAGELDRLVLVGDGPLRAQLGEAASSAARDAVEFAGRLTDAEVAARMRAADVLVLPSRAEGLGLVLLEALACGTPCVASSVGGVPEILTDGPCGRLVPPGDAGALADAIREVIAAERPEAAACTSLVVGHTVADCAERFAKAIRGILSE